MTSLILIIFLLYLLLMIFLLEGWKKATQTNTPCPDTPFISVIVPVRDEEQNIQPILDDLLLQQYPDEQFEVILVDDHSSDGSVREFKRWSESQSARPFRLVSLSDSATGKKSAIAEGISHADGEIIVTTDADCRLNTAWLRRIADSFQENVQLVSGPVRLADSQTFFGSWQRMEFASLVGSGAATLAWGIPTMCNGANLAYRKSAFEEVEGFKGNEAISSGDDEFLLRKVMQRYPTGARFNPWPDSVVTTHPPVSLLEFFRQRVRWAGKWKAHGIGVSMLLAVFIVMFHSSVIALVWFTIHGTVSVQDTVLLLGAKMTAEAIFLYRVHKFLTIPFSPLSFFALQIVYPLYVLFFGLTANFLRVAWKGRGI